MIYQLIYSSRFKKDIKRLQRRQYNTDLIKKAIRTLEEKGQLPGSYNPHKLTGNFKGYWEAHIQNDWLIIWKIIPESMEIWLTRTGTHADLF
ncbi:MAG: type II toxin-antitoxin system YafQ family toxin [Prolixibacteraceae bacterium]|nr:type II toxin-antitoxin system YafQ family toxin [Prolixibacteraceae bacterium]